MPKVFDDELKNVVCRCGGDAIRTLLQRAKSNGKAVKLSADTKADLVGENLRRAVADGHVSIDAVFDMVAEWEEHRPAYHLFFSADCEVAEKLTDVKRVRHSLWGPNWSSETGFPRSLDEPVGEIWADFRELPDGWIAKLYRGGTRWVLDESASSTTDERKVRVWNRKYQREVWCGRYYRHTKLLDMRIPNLDNKDDLGQAQQGIWTAFAKLVTPEEVKPFSLQVAAAKLARDEKGLDGRVHVSYSRFPGSKGGAATYTGQGDQEPLHNNPEFVQACRLFNVASEIVVHWKKTEDSDLVPEKTRTVIGSRGPNSLLFSAESTRKCVEHVIAEVVQLATSR
jgi:hypothetical protein